MPTILSLGSINADFQMRVDRWPEVSETLLAHDLVRLGGGKAANVAFLARRLDCDATLFGRVGDDDLAEQALAPLRAARVDLGHVVRTEDESTAISVITVPPDGKKGIILAAGANDAWLHDDIATVEAIVATAPPDSVLVEDCEVPDFIVWAATQAARRRDLRAVLDPSPADRVGDELLAASDVVVPNPAEAERLTGVAVEDPASATRAARALLDRGCRVACVKLPEGGCVVAEDTRRWHVSAAKVDVVDTTGAGDAFAGAMAVALAEGRETPAAAAFASAAAAHAVTGYGSQPAYPDRADIERMSGEIETSTLPDE